MAVKEKDLLQSKVAAAEIEIQRVTAEAAVGAAKQPTTEEKMYTAEEVFFQKLMCIKPMIIINRNPNPNRMI